VWRTAADPPRVPATSPPTAAALLKVTCNLCLLHSPQSHTRLLPQVSPAGWHQPRCPRQAPCPCAAAPRHARRPRRRRRRRRRARACAWRQPPPAPAPPQPPGRRRRPRPRRTRLPEQVTRHLGMSGVLSAHKMGASTAGFEASATSPGPDSATATFPNAAGTCECCARVTAVGRTWPGCGHIRACQAQAVCLCARGLRPPAGAGQGRQAGAAAPAAATPSAAGPAGGARGAAPSSTKPSGCASSSHSSCAAGRRAASQPPAPGAARPRPACARRARQRPAHEQAL